MTLIRIRTCDPFGRFPAKASVYFVGPFRTCTYSDQIKDRIKANLDTEVIEGIPSFSHTLFILNKLGYLQYRIVKT